MKWRYIDERNAQINDACHIRAVDTIRDVLRGANYRVFREDVLIYTNSFFSTLYACPFKARVKYIDGWRLIRDDNEALNDGRLWHEIMEKAGLVSDSEIIRIIDTQCLVKSERPSEARSAKFRGMYRAYLKRGLINPQRREVEFCIPLINPDTKRAAFTAELAGKIDGILTDETGNWIVEYKSASNIRPDHIQLDINRQLNIYSLAADVEIAGIIYDVIQKPGIKLKEACKSRKVSQTPDEYAAEVEAWYEDNPEQKFFRTKFRLNPNIDIQRELWNEHMLIRYRVQKNFWPKNTDSCFGTYGNSMCDYFNYCSSGESEFVLNSDFVQVENKHPELSPEIGSRKHGIANRETTETNEVQQSENSPLREAENREDLFGCVAE